MSAPVGEERQGGGEVPAAVAAISALGDPTRRSIYRYVVTLDAAVGREQVASALGIAPHVARFHLDRLHDAGLLEVEYKRPAGRGGPGGGHPTKLYRPAAAEYAVSLPERRYDIAGDVLTRAVAAAMEGGKPIGQALEEAAEEAGREIGAEAKARSGRLRRQRTALVAAVDALDSCGFAPRREGDGYVLANCPFRALAQAEPDVICRMNVSLVAALFDELGVKTAKARLDPAEGRCCVTARA